MTALAIGAAMAPPVASLTAGRLSTITATAMVGLLAGAKATNQVCTVLRPVWAVPVLPATWTPGTWAAVPVPPWTTEIINAVMAAAVWADVAWTHCDGWYVRTTLPSLSRTSWRTWGCMITPLLAKADATSAISSGVEDTSCWPIADLARPGWSCWKDAASGKKALAEAGRSSGGTLLKPKALASAARLAPPRSRPIWAKPVLHDALKRSASTPPQRSPAKLLNTCPLVWGSGRAERTG